MACSGQKTLKGYNDLQTLHPVLAAEWNYEKNIGMAPESFTAHSGRKVWWVCSSGHEWQATIASRTKGIGCPFCSGRYAVKGKSDLLTVNPTLATEWNYERNIGLTPAEILPNSNKKVWWKCKQGHEWQATVADRTTGINCPYCSGRYVIKGKNDLATINPTLADEWHYEKNDGLIPEKFTAHSGRKVWWICSSGHEWQATIANRSRNRGNGCPICAKEKRKKSK